PEEIKARDGALEAVLYLNELKVPMCAVSSGEEDEVIANLNGSGFRGYMNFFVSSEDVQNTKPHPEPYLKGISKLCEEFGWDADMIKEIKFVAVEDTITGVTSAKDADMVAVFWPENPAQTCKEADYTARSASELLEIFQTITGEKAQTLSVTRVPVRKRAAWDVASCP
ncbi:MAG: HAD family phosphatase, partial [Alphaproteobacteria bacterium]|nr:HAD family phosphatase [Alphaproteobacteria bacterium]